MNKQITLTDKFIVKKYLDLAKNELSTINRSISGKGTLKLLKIIKKEFNNFKISRIKSGSKVFDWKIPPEWNVKQAYVVDKFNNKIIDLNNNNLHLVGYSVPINKVISKKHLLKHLHSLPKQPKAIPYITSYYKKYWGFCITHIQKKHIIQNYNSADKFKVIINSTFNKNGYLNYGEMLIKGRSKQEILISTYVCHPSMANDELSGTIASMSLIKNYINNKLEKSLRFIFIPETIGSIAYLSKNLNNLKSNVVAGYNLTCIGDNKKHSCLLTKYGNTQADICLLEAYKKLKIKFKKYSFLERGSDERQFNSPGIDLPIASIFRTKYREYPEYHTSLDNFDFVNLKGLLGGYTVAKTAIDFLLKKIIPINLVLCEPQMGRRGLYPMLSVKNNKMKLVTRNYMHFLQYCDKKNDLESIAKNLKIDKKLALKIYNILLNKKLIF